MPQTIVVSGGAGFRSGQRGQDLDREILSLTGKAHPRVCYLATAAGDSSDFIDAFYSSLGGNCAATHLQCFLPPYEPATDALLGQDLIYVDGGNTLSLLAVWRAHGIDKVLAQALDAGTILYGHSSGGLCWFEGGTSGSVGLDEEVRVLSDGLALVEGSHCPHFDDPKRRGHFLASVAEGLLPPGVAVEEYGVARFVDGVASDISLDTDHGAFVVDARGPHPLPRG